MKTGRPPGSSNAVKKALQKDIKSLDAGKMGMGTKEIGDLVAKYVKE